MKLQPKDQVLLEQAYKAIHEAGMPPTAGAASRAGATGGADFEAEVSRIKIVAANLSDDIDHLRSMVEDIYSDINGEEALLPREILEVFNKIESRLEQIVPAESDF